MNRIVRAVIVACCLAVLFGHFEWLDTLLTYQCHRLPDRTATLFGTPMAVCSRCAGLYLGIALGAALAWPKWRPRQMAIVSLSMLAVLIVEVGLEWLGWLPPVHVVRAGLGMAFAWPIAASGSRMKLGTGN
ncbi:MAG: DUF2085 domain-containing protein [Deltaproteobacteria bacterium]|nr:DUF2085 domain-containing protein [Deltaproteobacteria bacterium]